MNSDFWLFLDDERLANGTNDSTRPRGCPPVCCIRVECSLRKVECSLIELKLNKEHKVTWAFTSSWSNIASKSGKLRNYSTYTKHTIVKYTISTHVLSTVLTYSLQSTWLIDWLIKVSYARTMSHIVNKLMSTQQIILIPIYIVQDAVRADLLIKIIWKGW